MTHDVIKWWQIFFYQIFFKSSIFLSRLVPYCQYSICTKFHVKRTKIFWDTAYVFTAGLIGPPPSPEIFKKAQLGLKLLAARKTNDFESIKVCTVKGPWIVLHCEKRITIQFKNKASSRSLHCVINLQKPNSFTKCHPDILNSSDAKVINCLSWDVA